MSVVVRIPTPLRRMTGGKDKVEVESGNLGAMVEELEGRLPPASRTACWTRRANCATSSTST